MTDDLLGRHAVELPVEHVRAVHPDRRGSRRGRSLSGLSGAALFVCAFLPAVTECNKPVMPYEVPLFLPPYVYGLVFALIALWRTPRALATGAIALRVLSVVVVLVSLALVVYGAAAELVEAGAAGVLLAVSGLRGVSERRVAGTALAVAVLSVIWFGLWSVSGEALYGVYLSCACALGLLVGGIVWLREQSAASAFSEPGARSRHRALPGPS